MITLCKNQQKYEDAIRWLYFGGVRSGRTTLQAKVICDWLCHNINVKFIVKDHTPTQLNDEKLMKMVCHELTDRGYDFKLYWGEPIIKVTRKLQNTLHMPVHKDFNFKAEIVNDEDIIAISDYKGKIMVVSIKDKHMKILRSDSPFYHAMLQKLVEHFEPTSVEGLVYDND